MAQLISDQVSTLIPYGELVTTGWVVVLVGAAVSQAATNGKYWNEHGSEKQPQTAST